MNDYDELVEYDAWQREVDAAQATQEMQDAWQAWVHDQERE